MARVYPKHVILATDADDLAAVKAYLDSHGYQVGDSGAAFRTDKDGTFTVEIDYDSWTL